MKHRELLSLAKQAREKAYAPYSDFRIGAALLCEDGRVFTGCNIENVSHTPTCCAERVAIFSALAAGERRFAALAVVGGKGERTGSACVPCGVCRQVMQEFCSEDFPVILEQEHGEALVLTLGQLLPYPFSL